MQLGSGAGYQYFDAQSQLPLKDFERRYAQALARHFTAETQAAVKQIRLIRSFDEDYLPVNRLLPVYRIDFDRADGLRAYVDVGQGQLATLVDDRKALLGRIFRTLHSWHWWPYADSRHWVIIAVMLLILMVALAGLAVYLSWWRAGVFYQSKGCWAAPRWHAHLSGISTLALLCFGISGLLHLTIAEERDWVTPPAANSLAPVPVAIPEWTGEAQWISVGAVGYWRLTPVPALAPAQYGADSSEARAYVYMDSRGKITQTDETERELALALAQQWWSGAGRFEFQGMQYRFDGEYGFINKRLPVARLALMSEQKDFTGLRIYFQLHTRQLAAVVDDTDRVEGYSFAFLHKWHHLNFLGKDVRDGILGVMALLILVAASLGAWRYWRRHSAKRKPVLSHP